MPGRFTATAGSPRPSRRSSRSLASGWKDGHLYYHAALIHMAAGSADEGKRLLKQTAEINPHFGDFHVHR